MGRRLPRARNFCKPRSLTSARRAERGIRALDNGCEEPPVPNSRLGPVGGHASASLPRRSLAPDFSSAIAPFSAQLSRACKRMRMPGGHAFFIPRAVRVDHVGPSALLPPRQGYEASEFRKMVAGVGEDHLKFRAGSRPENRARMVARPGRDTRLVALPCLARPCRTTPRTRADPVGLVDATNQKVR